jgi:hypothetical protein
MRTVAFPWMREPLSELGRLSLRMESRSWT